MTSSLAKNPPRVGPAFLRDSASLLGLRCRKTRGYRIDLVSLGTMKNRPFIARLGFALTGTGRGWNVEGSFRTRPAWAAAPLVVTGMPRPGGLWGGPVALSI